jgi:hypothetical protein
VKVSFTVSGSFAIQVAGRKMLEGGT